MSFRSIILNLHESNMVDSVVNAAMSVGEVKRSHLIGIHSFPLSLCGSSISYHFPPNIVEKIEQSNMVRANQIYERFEKKSTSIDFPTEWYLQKGLAGSGTRDLIEHVLSSDLLVISQNNHEIMPWLRRELLQKSTTPVLVAPSKLEEPSRLGQITIVWNGSIQTARAVRDAMNLLERADTVRIVCTGSESRLQEGQIAGSDVATWLSHHDIDVTLDEHLERQLKTGIDVVHCAQDGGADLLVMGGYGHSPLYDAVVGGMTDDVLSNASIPVFLSH